MSFELPFTSPRGWSLQKTIFAAIIVLHTCWIVFHLNMVSQGLLNPWKLGGYGMYTIAPPKAMLHVFDRQFPGVEAPISKKSHHKFRRENNYFNFLCQPLKEKSLQGFFRSNPDLVGHTLRFFVSQNKFLRNPIRSKRRAHSILEVTWTGPSTFQYTGQVCRKIYEGQLKLTE